jgi:hypothetical protein
MKPTMPGNHLYEYAVIRVVPRVEREEFMNVGVILYTRKPKFLEAVFHMDDKRLAAFCGHLDLADLEANLHAIERICMADPDAGPIAKLDNAGRFRWLTATKSTIVQCSKVHPGFCNDPKETLLRLFEQLVF